MSEAKSYEWVKEFVDAEAGRVKDGKVEAYLHALFKNRIAVLDGAMGTMIQGYKLQEEDFRGERCRDAAIEESFAL